MPNALGTLASSLIIMRALELVFTKRPILKNISLNLRDLDSGSVTAKWNQAILTRLFTVPAVNNFGTGAVNRADTDVSVTIDKFKEVHHAFTVQEISSTDRNLVDESADPIAVAIANHMVDAVGALWTAANFPKAAIVLGAGWDYSHLTGVRKAMQQNGVPEFKRHYCANSDVYQSFLNDPMIIAELNNARNAGAIATGNLPDVAGFMINEYPAMPNTGNLVGFAGTPDSVALAARVPRNPEEVLPGAKFPGNIGIITEPKTGLSVMVNEYIDAATLTANIRLIWMYGVAVGNPNNGQIIKSQ